MYRWGFALICLGLVSASHAHGPMEIDEDLLKFVNGASLESGRSIYLTGKTESGVGVLRKGGPHWLYVHGGSCKSCHGEDGRGGEIPHMCLMVSPAVTWKSLTGDKHKQGGGDEGHKHDPYTLESLRMILETGFRPGGKRLDECMPKWRFTDDEYRDLVAHLIEMDMTLQK